MNVKATKVPPSSIESEQSLLGGLMLSNKAWDDIANIIGDDDFYTPAHKIIFNAIANLAEHNKPVDILTVQEYLKNSNTIDKVGGFDYLSNISVETPNISNIVAYAKLVRELSIKRSLITSAQDIVDLVYKNDGSSASDILDFSEKKIFEISEYITRNKSNSRHIKDVILEVTNKIQDIQKYGISARKTGFIELDKIISGLQEGDLIIIAGRPSMGKTAFAINIIENIAINSSDKKPVAVFSLEMSIEQIIIRMLSSLGGIDAQKIKNGKLDNKEWQNINDTVNKIDKCDIIIDETPLITPLEIRTKCRKIKREYPELAVIMIDYLQLMSVGGNMENRVQEISQISRSLKALARELNVPIIALSQLNRSVEHRVKTGRGRMPQMADLRDSGAIEQDADIVIFIYRDEVYHDASYGKNEEIGKADIKIAKHRNGPIGQVTLGFQKEFARFINIANATDSSSASKNYHYEENTTYENNKNSFFGDDGIDKLIDGNDDIAPDDPMFDAEDI